NAPTVPKRRRKWRPSCRPTRTMPGWFTNNIRFPTIPTPGWPPRPLSPPTRKISFGPCTTSCSPTSISYRPQRSLKSPRMPVSIWRDFRQTGNPANLRRRSTKTSPTATKHPSLARRPSSSTGNAITGRSRWPCCNPSSIPSCKSKSSLLLGPRHPHIAVVFAHVQYQPVFRHRQVEFVAFQQIQPERGGVEVLDRYRLALRFLVRPQSLRPDPVIPVALRAEVEHGAVRRPRRLACVVLDADPLRRV